MARSCNGQATTESLRRIPFYNQDEVGVSLSPESETACCGQVLKPFWTEDGRCLSVCNRCGTKYTDKSLTKYKPVPWIGVDLDGTLAHDTGKNGGKNALNEIGAPVIPMLNRLRTWLAEGKTVKIFTARASSLRQVQMVKEWLASYGLPELEVTNVKDLAMIELWDDRCVQVITNSGQPVGKDALPDRHTNNSVKRFASDNFFSRLRMFLTL